MIVRELIARLGFDADMRGMKKWDQGAKHVQERTRGIATALRGAFGAFATWRGLKSLVEIADETQSLRARIGMLKQTAGDAGAAFDEIAKHANAARQDLVAYGKFYFKAGNATQDFIKDQATLLKVVDGAAMGLAAGGASAVEQKQAFFQLGQAIGSPAVQMEEMNTLIDVAPGLFRALGKAIPGANGNLKKFISTGHVTGKMLAEGLMKVLPEFEAQMRNIPLTVGQATSRVGNKLAQMIDHLNRKSLFVTRIANTIIDAFSIIEHGINSLGKKFHGLGNVVRFAGEVIVGWFGVKAVIALQKFSEAEWVAMRKGALLFGAIALGAAVLDDIITWFRGGNSVIGDLIGNTDEARQAFIGFFGVIAGGAAVLGLVKGATMAYNGVLLAWQVAVAAVTSAQWLLNAALAANPIGLTIAAIIALIAASALIIAKWKDIKKFFVDFFGWFGEHIADVAKKIGHFLGWAGKADVSGQVDMGVSPASMQRASRNTTVNKETNVNLTVPPGTTEEQQNFIERAAAKAFGRQEGLTAADMGVYAP